MIVIRCASGFDDVGGERIGNRDVIDPRFGRRDLRCFATMLVDRGFQRQAHALFAMLTDRAQQSRYHPRRFQFAVGSAQQSPQAAPGRAQLSDQLRRNLTHGVRLARQLRKIMTIADLARSKVRPRMRHALAHAGDADVVHPQICSRVQARPSRRH